MGGAAPGTPPVARCIRVPSQQRPRDGGGASAGSVHVTVDGCQRGVDEGSDVAEPFGCGLGGDGVHRVARGHLIPQNESLTTECCKAPSCWGFSILCSRKMFRDVQGFNTLFTCLFLAGRALVWGHLDGY